MSHKKLIIVLLAGIGAAAVGCKPDYPSCKKDAHCHPGEFCVNNKCQQCRDNADCGEGQECAQGACRDIPGYCNGPQDCTGDEICRDKKCGPCVVDADCGDGKACLNGACVVPECRSTGDCPAGLECVEYKCKVDTNAASSLGAGDCTMEPVYFDFDSSEITPEQRSAVEKNYDCFTKRGGTLTLEGHCDSLGTTEYNMALGERRANVVKKMITALGADGEKLRMVSKGEEEATGGDEASRAKDRRVDFE